MTNKPSFKPEPYINIRPWGSENRFCQDVKTAVKILNVNKGGRLSIQYHDKREEYWYVISGNPKILVGDKWIQAKPGDDFFITQKIVHSAESLVDDARILEIWFGEFDQSDIVRLEDKYGNGKRTD
jgi:mannose-6-phosphate isomerase